MPQNQSSAPIILAGEGQCVMPPMPSQRYTPAPKFLTSGASPYIPIDQFRAASCRGLAPSVTIRTAVPAYAAPPPPPPPSTRISSPLVRIAPPGCIRPAAPAVVDNRLLRMQQQESTPAIAPLPLVNNLLEPVIPHVDAEEIIPYPMHKSFLIVRVQTETYPFEHQVNLKQSVEIRRTSGQRQSYEVQWKQADKFPLWEIVNFDERTEDYCCFPCKIIDRGRR